MADIYNQFRTLVEYCDRNRRLVEFSSVQRLLNAGFDPRVVNNKGYNAIDTACSRGYVDIVLCLLRYDITLANACNDKGFTPGHAASLHGHVDIVRILICCGATNAVNNRMRWRNTPEDNAKFCKRKAEQENDNNTYNNCTDIISMWEKPDETRSRYANEINLLMQNPDLTDLTLQEIMHHRAGIIRSERLERFNRQYQTEEILILLSEQFISEVIVVSDQIPSHRYIKPGKYNPLHYAVLLDDVLVVKFLIDFKVDLYKENAQGYSVAQEAAAKDSKNVFYELLQHIDVNQYSRRGTVLHSAAQFGRVEMVDFLLKSHASPFALTPNRQTPLDLAYYEFEKLKINFGVNSGTHKGVISLLEKAMSEYPVENLITSIEQEYKEIKDISSALFEDFFNALKQKDMIRIRILLEKYPELLNYEKFEKYYENDGSAINVSATNGHVEAVEYLLDRNDVPTRCNQFGFNSLHLAAQNGHLDIVIMLLSSKRIDVNCTTSKELNSLHIAAQNGHLDIVQYLVEICKVNPNDRGKDGITSLHLAARCGHFDVVKYLVETCKVNPTATTQYSYSILHEAIYGEHYKVIEYLDSQYKKAKCYFNYVECISDSAKHKKPLREDIKNLIIRLGEEQHNDVAIMLESLQLAVSSYREEDQSLSGKLSRISFNGQLRAHATKNAGSNPKALYKDSQGTIWLGKMGFDKIPVRENPHRTDRTVTDIGVKLDAIKEKLGLDLYMIFSQYHSSYKYLSSETRLAKLPIHEAFITQVTKYRQRIEVIFERHPEITETIFAMSKYQETFIPLGEILKKEDAFQEGFPETVKIPGKNKTISTEPLIAMLAHARAIGDLDVFGVNLTNVGVVEVDGEFKWFKLDGTHVFKGLSRDDIITPVSGRSPYDIKMQQDPTTYSYKDIQYHCSGVCEYEDIQEKYTIHWNILNENQRNIFISELVKGLAFFREPDILSFFLREDIYQNDFGVNIADLRKTKFWSSWHTRQEEIYKDELDEHVNVNSSLDVVNRWLNRIRGEMNIPLPRDTLMGETTRVREFLLDSFRSYWDKSTNKSEFDWDDASIREVQNGVQCNQALFKLARGAIIGFHDTQELLKRLKEKGAISSEAVNSMNGTPRHRPTINFIFARVKKHLDRNKFDEYPLWSLAVRMQTEDLRHQDHNNLRLPVNVRSEIETPKVLTPQKNVSSLTKDDKYSHDFIKTLFSEAETLYMEAQDDEEEPKEARKKLKLSKAKYKQIIKLHKASKIPDDFEMPILLEGINDRIRLIIKNGGKSFSDDEEEVLSTSQENTSTVVKQEDYNSSMRSNSRSTSDVRSPSSFELVDKEKDDKYSHDFIKTLFSEAETLYMEAQDYEEETKEARTKLKLSKEDRTKLKLSKEDRTKLKLSKAKYKQIIKLHKASKIPDDFEMPILLEGINDRIRLIIKNGGKSLSDDEGEVLSTSQENTSTVVKQEDYNSSMRSNSRSTSDVRSPSSFELVDKENDATSTTQYQLGWNCFDVAVGILDGVKGRERIVQYALDHANELGFRQLLAPEIRHAAALTAVYLNEKKEADSKYNDRIIELFQIHLALKDEEDKQQVERQLGQLCRQFDDEKSNLSRGCLPKSMHSEELRLIVNEYIEGSPQGFDDYCRNEETYKQYIQNYYGSNEWFAFQRSFKGENSTSMIDIVARMLNSVIVIYQRDKEIYRTLNDSRKVIEINYIGNFHFERRKLYEIPAELIQQPQPKFTPAATAAMQAAIAEPIVPTFTEAAPVVSQTQDITIDPQELAQQLLTHVIAGDQLAAKALLEKYPNQNLSSIPGVVKDHVGREFQGTALQCAVASLDKNMWEMLLEKDPISPQEATVQLQEIENHTYAKAINNDNDKMLKLYNIRSGENFIKRIGFCQHQCPRHMLKEFYFDSNSERSFEGKEACLRSLPKSYEDEVKKKTNDWCCLCIRNEQKNEYIICKNTRRLTKDILENLQKDGLFFEKLLKTRTTQRKVFLGSLELTTGQPRLKCSA